MNSLSAPDVSDFQDLVSYENDHKSCYVSFVINHRGYLVDETLSASTVPWALQRIRNIISSKTKLDLNGWTKASLSHTNRLKEKFSVEAKNREKAAHGITVNNLKELIRSLCMDSNHWRPERFVDVAYYTILRKKSDGEVTDILNSFYLDDLEFISESRNRTEISEPLRQYLSDTKPRRIPVEERSNLKYLLSPKFLPLGRWPSPTQYSLSLMQQCAVNLTLSQIPKEGGMLSVNGPPGTGKTTLLRDIIADLIVQRAEVLATYTNPKDGFTKTSRYYRPKPSLTGFEVIVASSNNNAVENITSELPSSETIASEFIKDIFYFKRTATKVNENFIEKNKGTQSEIIGDSEKEDNTSCSSRNGTGLIWGLISAVLGNKNNCNIFCDGFWFDKNDSIRSYLKTKPVSIEQWKSTRRAFNKQKKRVQKMIQQRQLYSDAISSKAKYITEKENTEKTLQEFFNSLQEKKRNYHILENRKSQLENKYKELENHISTLKSTRPSFLSRLFSLSSTSKYEERMDIARQEYEACRNEYLDSKERTENCRKDFSELQHFYIQTQEKVKVLNETVQELNFTLTEGRKNLAESFADFAWWKRPDKELQLKAPWVDSQLNEAQTQLFILSLKLHEQFVCLNAETFMTNLPRWVDMVKGNWKDLTDLQVLHLWQTLFLVVPVISTTFASSQRLFQRLRSNSLGWLFIDEAGQAVPQAPLGMMRRSKHTVIVGDPLQIKPVFTLDEAVVEGVRRYIGVDKHWSPSHTSVQKLGDRVNEFGSLIEGISEPFWVGCPLWVHRRCDDPMFTLSNQIAYANRMVKATQPPKNKDFPLGDSCWIHVSGACQGRHWVPEQGMKVIEMLQLIAETDKSLPNLYIISPFRSIAENMADLMKKEKKIWANDKWNIKEWIKQSVGTVHTFQGKEADSVILILGTDSQKIGAAQWAASEPNILNVAATRAKHRLYIVGNRSQWAKLQYFCSASELLN